MTRLIEAKRGSRLLLEVTLYYRGADTCKSRVMHVRTQLRCVHTFTRALSRCYNNCKTENGRDNLCQYARASNASNAVIPRTTPRVMRSRTFQTCLAAFVLLLLSDCVHISRKLQMVISRLIVRTLIIYARI